MPRDHLPWFAFYPSDWIQDTQILTLSAKGAWINILCAMWIQPERGVITFTKRHLSVFLANASDDETHQITVDLANVADVEWRDSDDNWCEDWEFVSQITFKSRRMVREEYKRKQGLEADRRYRESKTSEKRPRNVPKTSAIYQKSEAISHINIRPPIVPQGTVTLNATWGEESEQVGRNGSRKNTFADFWAAFPKKKGKGAAEKAWAKINPTAGIIAAILASIEKQKAWDDWTKDNGQYIPHPATWLNQKRWEDEETEMEEEIDAGWKHKLPSIHRNSKDS